MGIEIYALASQAEQARVIAEHLDEEVLGIRRGLITSGVSCMFSGKRDP